MKQYVYLLILPIMFLISCSDDTVEEMGGSNHVLLERYPQEVKALLHLIKPPLLVLLNY